MKPPAYFICKLFLIEHYAVEAVFVRKISEAVQGSRRFTVSAVVGGEYLDALVGGFAGELIVAHGEFGHAVAYLKDRAHRLVRSPAMHGDFFSVRCCKKKGFCGHVCASEI